MSKLVAVDVAILPPPDITARAIALSDTLAAEGSAELRLDAQHLPHITLTQHFIREEERDEAFGRIDDVVAALPPMRVLAIGAGRSDHTLWIALEHTPELSALHERLMETLRGY